MDAALIFVIKYDSHTQEGLMGEQFGNLVRQYPWHIVCLVSLLFIVVQGLLIFLAKKNNWSLRVRPIQILMFVVLFICSLYMIITGQSTM